MGFPQKIWWKWPDYQVQSLTCGPKKPRTDYSNDGTFAPVICFETLWTLLAFSAINDLWLHQFDVKGAYLHGKLNEMIYMVQPPGYSDQLGWSCLLIRSLYSLRWAGVNWSWGVNWWEFKLRPGTSESRPKSTATPQLHQFRTQWLRHRFTTFQRVGTAIHKFGRCDSQLWLLDSQLHSQLLAGKSAWMVISPERWSFSRCILTSPWLPGHIPPQMWGLEGCLVSTGVSSLSSMACSFVDCPLTHSKYTYLRPLPVRILYSHIHIS